MCIKSRSMGVIVPNEDDEEFDFCSYECSISEKDQIRLIKAYMKRYEQGKESRPFIMIGRPLMGGTDLDIFYSLDGEIIFNFIFDEKIKGWIKEAGFVLGKVKSYNADEYLPDRLNITLSVSKRKSGETLFKQAPEEAMDYIEEEVKSTAAGIVEGKIKRAVKKYMSGKTATPYKVLIIPKYGMGTCTTLDGEEIATILDDEIIELAEQNNGVFGHITSIDYNEDGGEYDYGVWYTVRVSRSVPRLSLESSANSTKDTSSAINDFFPLFGFTLGKTTWKEAESMGYVVKIWKDGPRRYTDVREVRYGDDDGIGVFTSLMWIHDETDFTHLWKTKGFSWNNSYDEWMRVFENLGFGITVTKEPTQMDFNGCNVLSARFEALSPDGALTFEMEFDYGENGCYTSSPKTLDTIWVTYNRS